MRWQCVILDFRLPVSHPNYCDINDSHAELGSIPSDQVFTIDSTWIFLVSVIVYSVLDTYLCHLHLEFVIVVNFHVGGICIVNVPFWVWTSCLTSSLPHHLIFSPVEFIAGKMSTGLDCCSYEITFKGQAIDLLIRLLNLE